MKALAPKTVDAVCIAGVQYAHVVCRRNHALDIASYAGLNAVFDKQERLLALTAGALPTTAMWQ